VITPESTAAAEWRRYGTVPMAAALGYAMSVIHIYGFGAYWVPISGEFGWTRAQATFGLTIATLIQALFSVPIGILVGKIGPRLLGLFGIVVSASAFATFSTATGTLTNWYLLWGLMALATLPVQATIWTSAVASRFTVSRGMALAITLCGASVAQTLFPWLGTKLIGLYEWRTAFVLQAGIWLAIAFPIIFLFFRGAYDGGAKLGDAKAVDRASLAGVSFGEGLRSSIYHRLLLASFLLTFTIVALSTQFIPILTDRGIGKLEAAGLASLVGFSSIAGRLATGALLDRYRASLVGAVIFLLPVAGSLLLIFGGAHAGMISVAAICVGLTLGAEVDVIVFLTTRYFGLKNFGELYGGLLAAFSIGTATGPLCASMIFDSSGNYLLFLWLTIGFMVTSSVALLSLPHKQGY
jgi:MFS family permease